MQLLLRSAIMNNWQLAILSHSRDFGWHTKYYGNEGPWLTDWKKDWGNKDKREVWHHESCEGLTKVSCLFLLCIFIKCKCFQVNSRPQHPMKDVPEADELTVGYGMNVRKNSRSAVRKTGSKSITSRDRQQRGKSLHQALCRIFSHHEWRHWHIKED